MKVSILEQSVSVEGKPQSVTIKDSINLAKKAEKLGYKRFWVSEHHNHPTIIGTAPEILMAAIACNTSSIRIGSAGIMLPHYSPLKVAEQFRVLEAIAPNRIDLGLPLDSSVNNEFEKKTKHKNFLLYIILWSWIKFLLCPHC